MKMESFRYKLAGMRKPDDFTVYPKRPGEKYVKVQGSRSIGAFDPETGAGILNWKGSNPKYNPHLLLGDRFNFPREFIQLALNYLPSSGDEIGQGVKLI